MRSLQTREGGPSVKDLHQTLNSIVIAAFDLCIVSQMMTLHALCLCMSIDTKSNVDLHLCR